MLFGSPSSMFENMNRLLRATSLEIKQKAGNAKCIDIFAHSQGGFIARAYIQLYSGQNGYPAVRRLFSAAGVQGGYYCLKDCFFFKYLPFLKNKMTANNMYSNSVQNLITPSAYWKDPYNFETYSQKCTILAYINGECINQTEEQFVIGRQQITQLEHFYVFYSKQDGVIQPYFACNFDFYFPNSTTFMSYNQTMSYKNDRLGIKSLNEQQKYKSFLFENMTHLEFSSHGRNFQFYQNCVLPLMLLEYGEYWTGTSCGDMP